MKANKNRLLLGFILFTLFNLAGGFPSGAQVMRSPEGGEQNENWFELLQDPDARYEEVRSAFYSWWGDRTDYKGNGWKMFKRWEYINKYHVLPDGHLQSPDHVLTEYQAYMSMNGSNRSAAGEWTVVGPSSYPINGTSQPTGMGRINCIAFHPTDANTFFVGTPSGGIWRTTDAGASWENLSADLPKLGVSSILVDPNDPDVIYIGTGDRDGGDAPGLGVFKSTDGGASWVQFNSTMGNVIVGAMIMHPSNSNLILAATSAGIFKTTDGGATWAAKLAPGNFKDIKFKPGDPTVVYTTLIYTPARLYRSSNTGDNWSNITTIPTSGIGSRMVIAVTPANPAYVYLLQIKSSDATFAGLIRSTDSGLNFTTMSASPNILGYNCDGSGTASQATYDLCITADPSDANTVYVGGINTWKSTDGGASWSINSHWIGNTFGVTCAASVHADIHWLEWSPLTGRLYNCNDGGLYWTNDGGTAWTEISEGLEIGQVYKLGQSATDPGLAIIGEQDNGTQVCTGDILTTVIGGDGAECLVDYTDPNYKYGSYILGDLRRSVSGSGYLPIATSANGITEGGAWVTPFALHVTDPNVMFAGFANVYRTENVKAASSSSISWTAISSGETADCQVIEQSPADPDILYVVRDGELQRSDNANDPAISVSWSYCNLPEGYLTPTDLEAHPADPDILYASAGYSVYFSDDRGMTWTNMDPYLDLPELFVNCLVYDENSDEGIYIGNQAGVWYKEAGMSNWVLFSTGLPPVDVRELEIFYDPAGTQNRIKAATYGRGLWESDLIETGVLNPTHISATPADMDQILITWDLNTNNDEVMLAFNTTPSFGTPADGISYAADDILPGGGTVIYAGPAADFSHTGLLPSTTYYYKLWSVDGSTTYSGGTTDNAATFCTLVDAFPWSEGFEHSGSMPECWTQEYINGSNPWEMQLRGTNYHPPAAHTGTYIARNRALVIDAGYVTIFASPPINIGSMAATLTFWHTQEAWDGRQDSLKLFYKTSPDGEWNLLQSYTASIAGWTEETIALPDPTSTYFIGFESTVNAGYGICLDDLEVNGNYDVTWTGSVSSDWHNGANWSAGFVPSTLNNVTVPAVANQPAIGAPAWCKTITLEPGATLRVQPGAELHTDENP